MDDSEARTRIERLVGEEQELYERAAEGGLTERDSRRLDSIKVGLDQCWDLLCPRPARGEAPDIVKRYDE
jgi:Protein of unknown function (DUF2630)